MSHTATFFLVFLFYILRPSRELSANGICDERVVYHLIKVSEGYRCLCAISQSVILDPFCKNHTFSLNESWRMMCTVETNNSLACPHPLSKPSGAVIPETSTTKPKLSGGSGGSNLTTYTLRTDANNSLLGFLSTFMTYFQPKELPLGLIKDLYVLQMPIQLVSIQILKFEALGLVWIFFWFVLALFLPLSLITHFCFAPKSAIVDTSSESSSVSNRNISKIISGICINLLLLCLLSTWVLLLYSNQQISHTVVEAPKTITNIMNDLEVFVTTSKEQIVDVTTGTTQQAIFSINHDLDNVEGLLGKPFQQRLSAEAGIDTALVALVELQNAVAVMSSQTWDLLQGCEEARKIGSELQLELRDIFSQVLTARYQCTLKDRSLCDTLQPIGFDVVFTVKNLTDNKELKQLAQLNKNSSFNSTLETAGRIFNEIPKQISNETVAVRADIKRTLEKRRLLITESVVELEAITHNLTIAIRGWREKLAVVTKEAVEYDFWRWMMTLAIAFGILTALFFHICASPCGCTPSSKKTFCLSCELALSSTFCLLIWLLAAFSFLIGGHIHAFFCQPLNEHPEYKSISQLVDPQGLLFDGNGMWNSMVNRNISVGFAEFLSKCEKNESIFNVLDIRLPYQAQSSTKSNEDLFKKFVFEGNIKILNSELEMQLQKLSSILNVNMTNQRISVAQSITERDLNSFLYQLNVVGRKLSDHPSVKRMNDLAYRIRNVLEGKVETLTKLRDEIVFNVTRLEILILPLNEQLNRTRLHLKTIQLFLDDQIEEIRTEVVENYKIQLRGHLQKFSQNFQQVGNCHVLWKIFDVLRYNICDLLLEPMNSLSSCCFFCIFLFLLLVPMIVISIRSHSYEEQETPSMTRRLLEDQQSVWATPTSVCSPEPTNEIIAGNYGYVPRQELPLPPQRPPSLPRIEEPQHSQQRTRMEKYRARTPRGRFETLRLIQTISRKTR